jgi:ribosome recycling factor
LTVKIFDEDLKDEVIKTLLRSDVELNVSTEGKDLKVKLGTSKKEHVEQALKKIKSLYENFKIEIKEKRADVENKKKKL